MHCTNCDNTTGFSLTLACTLPVDTPAANGRPAVSLTLQCRRCDSLAVDGNPIETLRDYL
ncbi:hypothetical protein [Salarchaeum japonicum]|uniref:RNHCP domain-containing protein n=1 Tax=Salarchaeum japonicum TaxID=555573 RepID=A0AAV3SYN7_9EURY|nr:hypothetical protein [Salarchaeum japonicum]